MVRGERERLHERRLLLLAQHRPPPVWRGGRRAEVCFGGVRTAPPRGKHRFSAGVTGSVAGPGAAHRPREAATGRPFRGGTRVATGATRRNREESPRGTARGRRPPLAMPVSRRDVPAGGMLPPAPVTRRSPVVRDRYPPLRRLDRRRTGRRVPPVRRSFARTDTLHVC